MKQYQFRAHRGGSSYTPENTMPAFEEAIRQGFEVIETDPQLTKDGVIVLMHDHSINRTCRNVDGSPIEEEVCVREHTYEELLQYDAGIRMGEEFRGTKIPTLDELLTLAEGKNVCIDLDKKITTEELEPLLDAVARHNARVAFFCADTARIRKIQTRFPEANIVYEGETADEDLQAVTALVEPEHLTIWLYLNKPNFSSWLEPLRLTSPENCARVKKYGRLGIANINHTFDVREAMQYEPDIIEI